MCKYLVVVFVCLLKIAFASECRRIGDCACEYYDGTGIELKQILAIGEQPLRTNASNGDAYYFSPCKETTITTYDDNANITSNDCKKGYTLCKYDKEKNALIRLGELKETQFTSIDGLYLSYIKPNHSNPSTGTVLLIMLFVGLLSYFVIGATVNAFYIGARGMEVIPHLDFWRSLPGLVRDGAQFLQNGCRVPHRAPDPDSYDAI
uniref:Cation-dependent mannose-6-phosphate receptor n=1 Tax=Anopheles dirus TaxID=7168 RepID=A0A182N537_9DIPT